MLAILSRLLPLARAVFSNTGIIIISVVLMIGSGFISGYLVQRKFCEAQKTAAVAQALSAQQEFYEDSRKAEREYMRQLEDRALNQRVIKRDVIKYVQAPNSSDCTTHPDWVRIVNDAARGRPDSP